MKRLLALINWSPKRSHHDETTEEFDLPFTIDSHQPRHNPETETRPMVRIGNRDPKEIQRIIDLAG